MLVRCLLPWCPHTSFHITPRRLCLLLPPLLLLVLLLLRPASVLCPGGDGLAPVNAVCDQAARGLALGDLCRDLCRADAVVARGCPSHGSKAVVLPALYRDSQAVVLKARTLDLEAESEGSVHYSDEEGAKHFPQVAEFQAMVATHLALNMNLTVEGNTLFKLWPAWRLAREDFSPAQNRLLLESSMKNVWTLALDPEYVMSRLFKHYDVFPELYGSCGGLYMVEQLRPLPSAHLLQSLSFLDWAERARAALALLDLLEELDTMFHHPLHLCDVKAEHFGLSDGGRVKFLDLDAVQLRPLADRTVGDGTECVQDSDCDFFDCHGRCHPATKRCAGGVANNNLQAVCERVFQGGGLWGRGLLDSRHADRGLRRAVAECAGPESRGAPPGPKVLARLRAALQEVADMAERLDAVSD